MPVVYACICPDGAIATRTAEAIAQIAAELAEQRPDIAIGVRAGSGAGIEIAAEAGEPLLKAVAGSDVPVALGRAASAPLPDPLAVAAGDAELITVSTSRLALKEHFALGRALGAAIAEDERRIAIVCIGTLSHALDHLSRTFDPAGRRFDEQYRRAFDEWNVKWLVHLESRFRASAREEAAAQTAVLMGVLSECRIQPRALSYEQTSGVGHFAGVVDVLGARRKAASAASAIEKE